MQREEFIQSIQKSNTPAAELNPLLKALWLVGKGKWDQAHSIVQDIPSEEASRVHAYLHRLEGDTGNANYWYRRESRPVPNRRCYESAHS